MLSLNHSDRIHVVFDDHRLVAKAVLLLSATLVCASAFPNLCVCT